MATNNVSPKKGKVVDIPTVPTIGTATSGVLSVTVPFTASTQGGPATTFTALSNPGSITGSGSSSPIAVSGLTAGTAYTFTVRGTNATGSSEYSSASNSATPTAGFDFLVVAGGAGGGAGAVGGGGGAGGLRAATAQALNSGTTYTITVGGGGTAGVWEFTKGGTGGPSSIAGSGFTTIESAGGGGGGSGDQATAATGNSGGSGGGGNYVGGAAGGAGNTPSTSPSQGNNGAAGAVSTNYGGGGGGASAAGSTQNGGNGSSSYSSWGLATTSGQNVSGTYWFAGGGGGGVRNSAGIPVGTGGNGGGGAGSKTSTGTAGTANTGGGGGGTGWEANNTAGGSAGGSGIVILRREGTYTASATTGSPTRVVDGGYTYYKFTGNGSITI